MSDSRDTADCEVVDVRPKRATCPACGSSISITKQGQLWVHGPRRGDGAVCHGSNGTVGYRYRVTDSTIEKVPVGTHLIYASFRGMEDQQDVVNFLEGTHDGGWVMEFMDAGIKYEGHWYHLDGTSGSEQPVRPGIGSNRGQS